MSRSRLQTLARTRDGSGTATIDRNRCPIVNTAPADQRGTLACGGPNSLRAAANADFTST